MKTFRRIASTGALVLALAGSAGAHAADTPADSPAAPILQSLIKMAEQYAIPMIDFFKVQLTRHELSGLAQVVSAKAMTQRASIPTPQTFPQYVRDNMQASPSRDPSLDHWKTPYAFQRNGQIGVIFSAGPDRRYGTPDDIRHEIQLP